MTFSVISLADVQAATIRALGLNEELHVPEYPEAIAASIRRAASFLCPTTPRALVDAVLAVLLPIVHEPLVRDDVADLLDQMVSSGDLLEFDEVSAEGRSRLLYLGPPSFIEKSPGLYLLTGIRPLAAALTGIDIPVVAELHLRTATLDPATGEAQLRAAGLHKVSRSHWSGQPSMKDAAEYHAAYQQRLGAARPTGDVLGLTVMDPETKTRYYRGRWRGLVSSDSGDFVGRRPQAYGADLWCFVRVKAGVPERLVDLPVEAIAVPARDEAWRLQAAIDALNRTPQSYRVLAIEESSPSESVVDLFSPLPSWAERYLELVGRPVDKSRGALFSYRVSNSALPDLSSMLTKGLWMSLVTD